MFPCPIAKQQNPCINDPPEGIVRILHGGIFRFTINRDENRRLFRKDDLGNRIFDRNRGDGGHFIGHNHDRFQTVEADFAHPFLHRPRHNRQKSGRLLGK